MFSDVLSELIKLKAQRKSYVVLLGHIGMVFLIYLSIRTSTSSGFAQQLARELGIKMDEIMDGLYFARLAMAPTFLMILPIYICTLAGDMVAGEIQEGCLKLAATRPRSRTQIILSKLTALAICSVILCVVLSLLTLACGYLLFGRSGPQIILLNPNLTGIQFCLMSADQALERMLATAAFYGFAILALGTVTLFYSCLVSRMTTATVLGLTTYFICYFVEMMPQAEWIRPYLLSTVMGSWNYIWLNDPAWDRFLFSQCYLAAYILVFGGLSIAAFSYRDIR